MMVLPMLAVAKNNTEEKYLIGAVPEENGVVTFTKKIAVSDPAKATESLRNCINELVANGIEGLRTRIISDGKEDGILVAKVEEFIIFKKKPMYFDRTRIRYQISASVDGNNATVKLTQISYYYNEDMDGSNGVNYKAEEWITDKAAVNKAGTKLYPRSGKFRIKTIDRVEAIFDSIASKL